MQTVRLYNVGSVYQAVENHVETTLWMVMIVENLVIACKRQGDGLEAYML